MNSPDGKDDAVAVALSLLLERVSLISVKIPSFAEIQNAGF
jgi:hypothetical protein